MLTTEKSNLLQLLWVNFRNNKSFTLPCNTVPACAFIHNISGQWEKKHFISLNEQQAPRSASSGEFLRCKLNQNGKVSAQFIWILWVPICARFPTSKSWNDARGGGLAKRSKYFLLNKPPKMWFHLPFFLGSILLRFRASRLSAGQSRHLVEQSGLSGAVCGGLPGGGRQAAEGWGSIRDR